MCDQLKDGQQTDAATSEFLLKTLIVFVAFVQKVRM